MSKKIIFIILFLLIALPNVSQAKSKYFFSVGFSGMSSNSSGTYKTMNSQEQTGYLESPDGSDLSTQYSSLEQSDVEFDLESKLKWNNNYLSFINFSGGYTFSQTNTLVFNLSFNVPKKGYSLPTENSSNIAWKNPQGTPSSSDSNNEYSKFKIIQVSLHNERLISKSIFIQLGLNFNRFTYEFQSLDYYSSYYNSYTGKTIGVSTGLGYVLSLNKNKDFIVKTLYSINYHRNGDYGVDGLNLFLTGLSIGIEFRQF